MFCTHCCRHTPVYILLANVVPHLFSLGDSQFNKLNDKSSHAWQIFPMEKKDSIYWIVYCIRKNLCLYTFYYWCWVEKIKLSGKKAAFSSVFNTRYYCLWAEYHDMQGGVICDVQSEGSRRMFCNHGLWRVGIEHNITRGQKQTIIYCSCKQLPEKWKTLLTSLNVTARRLHACTYIHNWRISVNLISSRRVIYGRENDTN